MRRLDGLFTAWPLLGSRRLTAMLKVEGLQVNRKRAAVDAEDGHRGTVTGLVLGHKTYPYLCAT
ncbi:MULTISPECIES: hypothetical protein [Bradyrhizobium]